TTVDSASSKAEIERTLRRYGADQFASGWDREQAMIAFRMRGRHYRFRLSMPDPTSAEFTLTPSKRFSRSARDTDRAYEQAVRQRWRALALVIKAKMEAVDSGISTIEDEFLAATLLPDGQTVGEWARERVKLAYASGQMPGLLPGLPPPAEAVS